MVKKIDNGLNKKKLAESARGPGADAFDAGKSV